MSLYVIYKNVCEMFKNRGYKVNIETRDNFNKTYKSIQDFTFLFNEKDKNKIVVKYIYRNDNKKHLEVPGTDIEEFFNDIKLKYNPDSIIFLSKIKVAKSLPKVRSLNFNIVLFEDKFFKYNLTRHSYFSMPEKMTMKEIDELLEDLSLPPRKEIKFREKFPLMLNTGIVAKYFNFKAGDFIRTYPIYTNFTPYYRFVIASTIDYAEDD